MALQPTTDEQPSSPPPGGVNLRLLLSLVVVAVIAAAIALAVTGGKASKSGPSGASSSASTSPFSGSVASPPEPEAPLALRNYDGERVDISRFRGKAVLVTFIYTHCPDVCPLIVSNLRAAQELLGKQSSQAQILAVSVDSRGDTRRTVARFLSERRMTGRMKYLIGSSHELATVWKAWGVGSERDTQHPELVEHTGLVYGISSSGKIMTLYPGNFKPQEIAHDVPLLAAR